MMYSQPIYSSRITKVYLAYLHKNYPDIDIEQLLNSAGMAEYEVENPAHWFSQGQVDRFNTSLVEATADPHVSRKAGRFATSTEGIGAVKQYALGLLNPGSFYLLLEKGYLLFSRGAVIKTRRLGPNKIEIISTPNAGVSEKPYQCDYRIGMFESSVKLFIQDFAQVEHPECIHEGQNCCRYIVTWAKRRSLVFRQIRNLILAAGTPLFLGLFFVMALETWAASLLSFGTLTLFFSYLAEFFGRQEIASVVKQQGNPAKNLIDEMRMRHENALLVQEIGNATSSIFDVDKLVGSVTHLIERHLDFDRGIILLADRAKTRLTYAAGYGYDQEKKPILEEIEFNLDNPDSRGVFVLAFRDQKPFLVEDIAKIEGRFSKRSVQFIKDMGVRSLICVPIIYKNEALGILGVDNIKTKRLLTSSDVSLLMGVASQTAVGIMNALSFQKLQEREKNYRELVENANSIIMRIDIGGNVTFFNEYAQRLFGYTENEILAKKALDIFQPAKGVTSSPFSRIIEELERRPDNAITNERRSTLKNGAEIWIVWTYKPIYNRAGTFSEILCIGNDITALKQAEHEKEKLEGQLQRAHKMEAIGTLAGGVAHDLNNILSGIVSYPDLLLMGLPTDSPLYKPLLTIQKSGKKAAAIVQDLLTLARRGVVTKEVVNLNAIIREYLNSPEFEDIQERYPDVRVKTDLPTDILNMKGSPVHLSKTVMNLVNNAIEAVSGAGEVVISTENKYVDTLMNVYDQVKDGEYVTLSVIDTGIGISTGDLERIFEPFYSKKVMGKSGTGLGMAVVWGTVKDHNGYIDVKSNLGKGSAFTLYFPIVRDVLPDTQLLSPLLDRLMGQGELILIVDDVKEQRDIASEMLNLLGYKVKAVPNGEGAVAYVQNHTIDLVVLDMIMGEGMDGLATYKEILQFRPKQKAIITSGYAETERVKEALQLGAGAYIKKPYLLETIGSAVKAELNGL